MKKPVSPCYKPGGNCDKRTIWCKTDGSCPYGYAEYEEAMIKYRELVLDNRLADGLQAQLYARRREEAVSKRRKK